MTARTRSDHAREMRELDPTLTLQQIADTVGLTRQAVAFALKVTPGRKGGRPRKHARCEACGGTGRAER